MDIDEREPELLLAERDVTLADRDRQAANLARARAQLRRARRLLEITQSSKFWSLRNRWFALKQRLRIDPTGPEPVWLPEVHEADAAWTEASPYERWMQEHRLRASDLHRMRETVRALRRRPVFSVLMPVYDTPEAYLRAAIDSVRAQVYPDWELCIADDASPSPHVRRVLEKYAALDSRIKLAFREANGHIAAASNTALQLATGEFVALFDHDDVLSPDALYENALEINRDPTVDVLYSDEDKIDDEGERHSPYFKPDWSPESVLSRNYCSHFGVYRRSLVEDVGGFRTGFEGSQDYDLLLRVTERSDRVAHLPHILYHWRVHPDSTAATRDQKGYALQAAIRALEEALVRRGEPGRVIHDEVRGGLYTVRYEIRRAGKVSIIIPTRDHGDDVDLCLRSIFERSTYADVEIVLLDNGSRDPASLAIFEAWARREPERIRVVRHDVPFNFSEINNFAVAQSSGEYVLLLNNDTEVIAPDWIEAMVEQAQRPAIGAVGAKLLYPDDTVQHAGVVVGLGGVAGHAHKYFAADAPGYFYTLQTVNNVSAVTAACLMVRRAVFDEVGGFDPALPIAFNDVDFCLKIRARGYRNVYLPHVTLYHHESKSRGHENTPEKQARFLREQHFMHERWKTKTLPDPYYNINLTLNAENYEIGL